MFVGEFERDDSIPTQNYNLWRVCWQRRCGREKTSSKILLPFYLKSLHIIVTVDWSYDYLDNNICHHITPKQQQTRKKEKKKSLLCRRTEGDQVAEMQVAQCYARFRLTSSTIHRRPKYNNVKVIVFSKLLLYTKHYHLKIPWYKYCNTHIYYKSHTL